MAVLTSQERTRLERAVIKARDTSLAGAHNALKAFAVDNHEPFAHMTPDDRALRNLLRSKARLLGDTTTASGGHTINKLAYELAYEYWHRMLFARFLEANQLLMHPTHDVAVSLEECEELGAEEGYDNKWEAASFYASKMLPAIFRQDDPLMQLQYATEDRLALEEIIESLSQNIFEADDSLGWVYQYWQTKEKERVNLTGDKITGETLPAVTQLFTEPYMVHFLIDNTLGAWWTSRNPGVTPPVNFEYLRTLDDGTPAAGKFEGWPDQLKDVTMLDPCMGSGHFVVEVFKKIAAFRMHDEKLSKEEACDVTIRENIHGLELDDRCTQIAAFNLAMEAWKFCGQYRKLPEFNLACCGIAPKGKKEDWVKLADAESDPTVKARLKGGLARMYDLFQLAPELGSLIDPKSMEKDAFTSDFDELQPFLENALSSENNLDKQEGIIAAGIAKAGQFLSKKYVWQITNVPYLSKGKQGQKLFNFCIKNYAKSKNDLATVSLEKMLFSNIIGGTTATVIPHDWLFKPTYEKFRADLLKNFTWEFVTKLGSRSFQTPMYDFNVMLLCLTNRNPFKENKFIGLDLSAYESANEKDTEIKRGKVKFCNQVNQLANEDSRISFETIDHNKKLYDYSTFHNGLQTGDYSRFGIYFWEIPVVNETYSYFQSTVSKTSFVGGMSKLLTNIESIEDKGIYSGAVIRGRDAWGKNGIAISASGKLKCSMYFGQLYDDNTVVIIPKDDNYLLPLWNYCSDNAYYTEVRKINQALKVRADLIKVPFDKEYWFGLAKEKYPNGLPKPITDDPTQWLYHGHSIYSNSPIQITIARLMGYQWPSEHDNEMQLAQESRDKIKAIHDLNLPFDEDGIVCITSVNGELSAAERLRENIIKIWGDNYSADTIKELITQEGSKKRDLEEYLRDDFFSHHCKLFKNRPFIWHIWDGRKDGFSALVNYHKLDKTCLEKLIYAYLGDWINQCKLKKDNNVSGADGLLSAAEALKEKLVLILKGEPPYDIFIRWKALEDQPIGWEPDINDGVRLNIYPFVEAGVLRKKFNVKWKKDRGKNPSGSAWGPERHNRYEDLDDEYKLKDDKKQVIPHLTNEIKRAAREAVKQSEIE